MRQLKRFIMPAVLSLPLFPGSASATGACCSFARADSGKMNLTLVGASARSHEMIGDISYSLTQTALMLKLGQPVGRGFVLQAQIGLPAATRLSGRSTEMSGTEMSGNGGLIYGIGFGYKLPQFLDPVDFFASASYSRALAYLDRSETGAIDQAFRIAELQALFIGETALAPGTTLYGGLRAYSGKNQLKDNRTGDKVNGEQEGNIAGLAGIRHSFSDNFSLTADAGFGHTKVIGIGAVFSF